MMGTSLRSRTCLKIRWQYWLHNCVIVKPTELNTLNEQILWYVSYNSIKPLKKKTTQNPVVSAQVPLSLSLTPTLIKPDGVLKAAL